MDNSTGKGCLVVTRSSNPEGRSTQGARDEFGRSVEEALLGDIGALNATLAPGEIGPIGAVVGPTHIDPTFDLVGMQGLFLAPGVGAEGATASDVAQVFAACPNRVIPVHRACCRPAAPTHAAYATPPLRWPPSSAPR